MHDAAARPSPSSLDGDFEPSPSCCSRLLALATTAFAAASIRFQLLHDALQPPELVNETGETSALRPHSSPRPARSGIPASLARRLGRQAELPVLQGSRVSRLGCHFDHVPSSLAHADVNAACELLCSSSSRSYYDTVITYRFDGICECTFYHPAFTLLCPSTSMDGASTLTLQPHSAIPPPIRTALSAVLQLASIFNAFVPSVCQHF